MAYKLYYFNFKGLAEPIRYLLSYGNINFEDNSVTNEDWPNFKDNTPLEQLPMLVIGDKKLNQSISVCRYLAKEIGLDGKTSYENFEIDSVADSITDFRMKITAVVFEKDATIKEEKRKALHAETIPFYLRKLEAIAKANDGHLALKRLTWVDFYFAAFSTHEFLEIVGLKDLAKDHASLKKVLDNIFAMQSIQQFIAQRPKTDKFPE